MSAQTQIEGNMMTFEENVAAALTGKEHYLLEQVAGRKVQLYTSAAAGPVGVMREKLAPDSVHVAVRLLGKNGTVKVIQSETIAEGARVKAVSGGKVATAGVGDYSIGTKLTDIAGDANDVIEISDSPSVPVITRQTLAAPGNANGAIAALTSSATTTQAEFNALRNACETLADDVRDLRAKLVAAGVVGEA